MKRIIGIIFTCFMALAVFHACASKEQVIQVTAVSVNQPSAQMIIGETLKLTATVSPSDASEKKVTWSSSQQSVASVSEDGLVTALAEGTTTITAAAGGKTGSCDVTVSKGFIAVESITLTYSALPMVEGDVFTLTATVKPDDATDPAVTWSSSDINIATVDAGKVTAIKEGEAIIQAKAGEKTVECKVTVSAKKIDVSAVQLSKTELSLIIGQEFTLIATIVPENATVQTIEWSTSNADIATVENGKVIAIKEGTATIKAEADGKTAECSVTVDYIHVQSITLDKSSATLYEGEEFTLNTTITPDDATYSDITWTSDDPEIAKVEGGKVTAIKKGSATIKAEADGKSALCQVEVLSSIAEISLSKSQLSMIIGDTETLEAIISPEDATLREEITWSSTDKNVATVDNNGKVTAIKEGTAIISATVEGKKAECAVTVDYIHVQSITLDKPSATLYEGEEFTLNATITPEDATYSDITWTSNDPQIATVEDGKVVAKKKGSTTIKAEADGKSAICQVEVLSSIAEITLSKSELSMIIGDTETLEAIITPADATLREEISWSSTNENVATVDNGKVTAIKEGTVTISATVEGKIAECKVTVDYIHVSSIEISEADATLYIGESITLSAEIKPSNATYNSIEWVSSNNNVVTINDNGYVTAVGKGEATVTAKSDGKEAKCHFTVLVPLTGLSFDQSSLTLNKGASATLTVIKTPSDATLRGEIVWTSSDKSVATINADGLVTAIDKGSANITASVDGCTATCKVTVNVIVPVSSITLNQGSLKLKQNETAQLVATVGPEDANDKTVTWSSSDTSIATVDSTGLVKALKEGTAVISAKAGDKTATCSLTVSNSTSGGHEGTGDEDWN